MSPLYHSVSASQIETVKKSLPHALLLDGPVGIGLLTAAKDIAGTRLSTVIYPTDKHGAIDIQKGTIRIEQIRRLYETTRSKSTTSRVIIVDDADRMTQSAQHAFLKLLEEPTPNTQFMLTAHSPQKLLATVRSRMQRITLRALNDQQIQEILNQWPALPLEQKNQLLFLAPGLPAELSRLVQNQSVFEDSVRTIRNARVLLQGSLSDKLLLIQQYQRDRDGALVLLSAARAILEHSLRTKPSLDTIAVADILATVYDRINANGNIRLQLLLIMV